MCDYMDGDAVGVTKKKINGSKSILCLHKDRAVATSSESTRGAFVLVA